MNFKRVLSKSSLRSSTSSRKNEHKNDEIKKLLDEILTLKLSLSSLKVLLENRDVSIENLASEKEKLFVKLKSIQRTNRNLQQELVDEREIHSKEKDYLLDNIKKLSLKIAKNKDSNVMLNEEEHILALQNEIESKDEVIYNTCGKYFKLKKNKEELQNKLTLLQKYTLETFESVVKSLENNKNCLDFLLDELRRSAKINSSHKIYVKLLKNNADLNFENTQLKLLLIANNEFNCVDVKEESKTHVLDPQCSQFEDIYFDVDKYAHKPKSTFSVTNYIRRSKIRTSKLSGIFCKMKNTNVLNIHNKIHYRSLSDSLLSRKFYK